MGSSARAHQKRLLRGTAGSPQSHVGGAPPLPPLLPAVAMGTNDGSCAGSRQPAAHRRTRWPRNGVPARAAEPEAGQRLSGAEDGARAVVPLVASDPAISNAWMSELSKMLSSASQESCSGAQLSHRT